MNLWWASLLFEPEKLVLRWVLYNRSFKKFKKQKLGIILFKKSFKKIFTPQLYKTWIPSELFFKTISKHLFFRWLCNGCFLPIGLYHTRFRIINTKSHNPWKRLKRNRPSRCKSLKHSRAEQRSLFKVALISKVTLIIIKSTKNYSIKFCSF